MDDLLNKVNFDLLTLEYLQRIEAKVNNHNLGLVRDIFNNNPDDLLDSIINIDEVRKSASGQVIILRKKVKRFKKAA